MLAEVIIRIAAEEAAEERRGATWRPRCSSAGLDRCSRREVYAALGATPAPLPGRTVLVFEDGDWGEELTLDRLRRSAYSVHSTQMPLNPCVVPGTHRGYQCSVCAQRVPADALHGHIDAIVTGIDGVDRLLEHKTTSRFGFARWATGFDLPMGYIAQAAFYIVGLRQIGTNVSRDGIILIKCKDTAQLMEIHVRAPTSIGAAEEPTEITKMIVMEGDVAVDVPLQPELRRHDRLLQRNVERFQSIARHRDAKTLPDRPFPWGYFMCDYCPFGRTCWDGYAAHAKSGSVLPVVFTGAQADLLVAAAAAGEAARHATAVADDLKDQVKVALVAADARVATAVVEGQLITAVLDLRSRTTLNPELIPPAIAEAAKRTSEFEVLNLRSKPAASAKEK